MSSIELQAPLSKLPNFDPRTVPVVGVDTHLPPVAAHQLTAQALQQRFVMPPVWQPELLAEPRFSNRRLTAASVLVPIVLRERLTVLLTMRTAHMSTHSGQIAFPGGKQDDDDIDLTMTALREAREEIGLQPEFVRVLGSLPIYRTGSAFDVTPVVALVDAGFSVTANSDEVDDVFEVPLEFLMNPSHHRRHMLDLGGLRREWLSMPYQDRGTERFIWGATAGMLRNFYRFLSA